MEEFFPSEIARLVLGYLHELKCKKSWQTFIEESSNLTEYLNLYKIGKVYSTNVSGKSLLDILKEYCSLKKEAMEKTYKIECEKNIRNTSPELENNNALRNDVIEQIFKNPVDHASQQYFSSVCKDISHNNADNQATRSNTEEKSLNDFPKNIIADNNNETNISFKFVNENIGFTSPQLTDVISLSNFDSSKKKSPIFKNIVSNSEREDEPVCLLETIKIENPDPDSENIKICAPIATVHFKDSNSTNSCNIVEEFDAENKSDMPVSDFALSNNQQDNGLILNSVNNADLKNLFKLKNDLNNKIQSSHFITNEDVLDTSDIQNNVPTPCPSLCEGNNIEVTNNSTLNTSIQEDNVVQTLNSSSNQSAFTVVSNSLPNQCVSSDNVPTYILSNFLSNSCFLINSMSNNNIPLTVTGLPINNIPNHTFIPIDSRSNEISHTMPLPTSNISVLPAPAIVENTKTVEAFAVDEKVHSKRKKIEVPSESPKRIATAQSTAFNKLPDQKAVSQVKKGKKKSKKAVNKVQNAKPKLRKGCRRKQSPKEKLFTLFESPPLT